MLTRPSDISCIAHQISIVSNPEYDGIVSALRSFIVGKLYGSSLTKEEHENLLKVLNKV